MKSVKVTLGRGIKRIVIYIFADWHIGDKNCDMVAIRKQIDEVRNNPNAYIICNGDLMNNATKTSVSDCYAEEIPPMEQIKLLAGLLEPVKDRILIWTQGNHEARTYRNDGIDLTAIVANMLGKLDAYCREGGVLFLRFGEQSCGAKETGGTEVRRMCYTVYVTHGSGGGRKEGAKAIRLADMASTVDCDIYVHSHTHLPMVMKQGFFRVDKKNSSVSEVEKLFVNSAASLKYGGYGQAQEFKPTSNTTPLIYLDGTKKGFAAKL